MVTRRVVCLAASIKHGGFCYAGKDVETGLWVRPVSDDPGHAISRLHRMVGKGDPAMVGDVLRMPLGPSVAKGYQTENHQHLKEWWRRAGTFDFAQARTFLDHPPSLWGVGHSSTHGVHDDLAEAEANAYRHSLCLVEVDDLVVTCADEGYQEVKLQTRAAFTYRGTRYRLRITDPEYSRQQCDEGDHPIGYVLLCCSLTEPYVRQDGSSHVSKLVAAIITRERLG